MAKSEWRIGEITALEDSAAPVELTASTPEGAGSETTYAWISIPGAHPLKVKRSVVFENGLDRFIVTKEKQLKQIQRYQNRGFIRSLLYCCNNADDVVDALETMSTRNNSILME